MRLGEAASLLPPALLQSTDRLKCFVVITSTDRLSQCFNANRMPRAPGVHLEGNTGLRISREMPMNLRFFRICTRHFRGGLRGLCQRRFALVQRSAPKRSTDDSATCETRWYSCISRCPSDPVPSHQDSSASFSSIGATRERRTRLRFTGPSRIGVDRPPLGNLFPPLARSHRANAGPIATGVELEAKTSCPVLRLFWRLELRAVRECVRTVP